MIILWFSVAGGEPNSHMHIFYDIHVGLLFVNRVYISTDTNCECTADKQPTLKLECLSFITAFDMST